MLAAIGRRRLRPALAEWWAPRLLRIADWVAEQEMSRRAKRAPTLVRTEIRGEWTLDIDGPFLMIGRADRIETSPHGIAILDYKTGVTPTDARVRAGEAPQLPLEAAMAEAGAFGADLAGPACELVYWHLTGGFEPGKAHDLLGSDPTTIAEEVAKARAALRALLTRFSREDAPYLSQPHPGRRPRFPDYAHLARCAEWDVLEDAP
jgi:ATP-dependent helicase/nuclease subunit B